MCVGRNHSHGNRSCLSLFPWWQSQYQVVIVPERRRTRRRRDSHVPNRIAVVGIVPSSTSASASALTSALVFDFAIAIVGNGIVVKGQSPRPDAPSEHRRCIVIIIIIIIFVVVICVIILVVVIFIVIVISIEMTAAPRVSVLGGRTGTNTCGSRSRCNIAAVALLFRGCLGRRIGRWGNRPWRKRS